MRILIAGGPRAGKTTLGRRLADEQDCRLRSTDDLMGLYSWSDASMEASRWFSEPAPWIIEGVAVPRAIRKWFRRTTHKPCEVVYWLGAPRQELTPGQAAMAKGCRKVWDEVIRDLERAGVEIRYA